jgi:sialic acid synthase SpsE
MLGDGRIDYGEAEKGVALSARRSLFAGRVIRSGSILSEDDIVALRPGTGIPASAIGSLVGRRAKTDIDKDVILRPDYFE